MKQRIGFQRTAWHESSPVDERARSREWWAQGRRCGQNGIGAALMSMRRTYGVDVGVAKVDDACIALCIG